MNEINNPSFSQLSDEFHLTATVQVDSSPSQSNEVRAHSQAPSNSNISSTTERSTNKDNALPSLSTKDKSQKKSTVSQNTIRRPPSETIELYTSTKLLIERLTKVLNDGQLNQAIELHKICQDNLHKLGALEFKEKKVKNLLRKLNVCYFQIRELRDWRNWGVDQNRVGLIKNLEQLKEFQGGHQELYARIKAIQKLWSHLNKTGDYPSRPLRERYSKAGDEAFKPCREYFKEQKRLRNENKRTRKELCKHLSEFFDSIDWSQPDWALINVTLRDSRKRWKKAVPLHKKDWVSTNLLYGETIKNFEPYINHERKRGVAFRVQLIKKVHELDSLPIRVAIKKTKEYQKDWKTIVFRDRNEKEKELWKQFRSACDHQFERRAERIRSTEKKKNQAVDAKKELINEFKTLNRLPAEKIRHSAIEAEKIQQQWTTVSAPDPRTKKLLEMKFYHEVAKFRNHVRNAEKKSVQSSLAVLAKKAAICEKLELTAIGGESDSKLQLSQTNWDKIAGNCGEFESAINERFKSALDLAQNAPIVISEDLSRILAKNLAIKQKICLQLEICTELDSPPEFSRERMLMNVERLKAAMSKQETNSDTENKTHELLVNYWLTGAVPVDALGSLQQRFNRIYDTLSTSPDA